METATQIAVKPMSHRERVISACKAALAMEFDIPACDILSLYGAKLGLTWQQMREVIRAEVGEVC